MMAVFIASDRDSRFRVIVNPIASGRCSQNGLSCTGLSFYTLGPRLEGFAPGPRIAFDRASLALVLASIVTPPAQFSLREIKHPGDGGWCCFSVLVLVYSIFLFREAEFSPRFPRSKFAERGVTGRRGRVRGNSREVRSREVASSDDQIEQRRAEES